MRVLPQSIVVGRYMAARTGAAWHNGGSRTVAAVRLPGFRDGLSSPSGCSAGMQSPRSAAAVSLPLLQRSGLSASHPDQSASVDANVGLVPTQSPPLIGINSPAGVLLARGDAVEAPHRRTAHPHVGVIGHYVLLEG